MARQRKQTATEASNDDNNDGNDNNNVTSTAHTMTITTPATSSSSTNTSATTVTTTQKKSLAKSKKGNAIETLRTVVPSIFQESQKTSANHRKNAVMLRKIQEQCAEIAAEKGEEAFNKEFIRNLNVVLAIKKREPAADRVIQFVSSFILCTREKDMAAEAANEDEEGAEGISSRFVEYLMHHLLKGVRVKEKLVRLRSCQLIALSINSLGAIDEVRRSALFNVEHTRATLPSILERARDTDAYNRRGLFTKPMDELSDFRVLSIDDRERLLRYGLSDRDENVRKACTKMLSTKWIQQADNNLIEFLERLDVMSSEIADEVLKAFFDYRADILGSLVFNDVFWLNLTVESAFLVRAFAEFCRSKDDDIQFERAVPEVTRHAYYIQRYSNQMQKADEDNRPEAEFIVTQLLMIAKLLDYADENGRRKMFNLLREMLMLDDIPDNHLDCILETMGKISLNEKDFTRIVIEIISDIRAGIDEQEYLRNPEKSDTNLRGEDPQLALKKLVKAQALKENSYMYGLLNELVIPALGRQEEVMQELGLHCLGLICMLDQNLAQSNMELFLTCIFAENASIQLQILSLKIVFDLILTFGMTAMSSQISEERIIQDLAKSLEGPGDELQAVAVEGIAKLMLTKLLKNAKILRQLIILYFDPQTTNNNHLRQCLNYFLQVYFHSSHDNQVTLSQIFVPIIIQLIQMRQDKGDMPSPTVMAQQILEWCEPRRVLGADKENEGAFAQSNIDFGLQADIAIEVVKAMFTEPAAVRKHLPVILYRCRLDGDAGEIRLKKLTLLIGNLNAKRPINERLSKKYLVSVEKSILKMFEDAPESLNDEELNKLVELTEEISFVDKYVPPDDADDVVPPTPSASRSSRSSRSQKSRPKARRVSAGSAKLAKILKDIDAILESSSESEGDEPPQEDSGSEEDVREEEEDEEDEE
ncbi:hypothetical protein BX616_008397 [Lobosporangium transversale]|nr:hypothetical protein BX616_008397 [Lobosporangium transversale]